ATPTTGRSTEGSARHHLSSPARAPRPEATSQVSMAGGEKESEAPRARRRACAKYGLRAPRAICSPSRATAETCASTFSIPVAAPARQRSTHRAEPAPGPLSAIEVPPVLPAALGSGHLRKPTLHVWRVLAFNSQVNLV